MIIGVTGNYAAGKDTIAEMLQSMRFFHVSFSDILREELAKQGKEPTRDNLILFGNELREQCGANVLARKALEKVQDGENYVFTSIRNPGEVELLLKRADFLLITVVAPDMIRLERMIKRGRAGDPETMEELQRKEGLENSTDRNAQQLQTVARMARVTIVNDATLEELRQKVEMLIQDWLYRLQEARPSWDDYFMNIAENIKTRATCMSSKKGSLIVKDRTIVSTGYNGTPKGTTHCTAGGCPRCTSRHLGKIKSGEYSEPCICCHAEENAIVQAAFNGTATKGATLYTTFTPCTQCAKMIVNAGIVHVIAKTIYPDDVGTRLLKDAGIRFDVLGNH